MDLRHAFPGVTHWQGHHLVLCNWRDSRHPQAGGAEQYCRQVAGQLHRAGVRVTYLTARPSGSPRREETAYGTVVRGGGRFTVYLFALLWLLWHRRGIDAVLDSQNGIPFFCPLVLPSRTPVVLLVHHVHQQQFAQWFPPPVAALGRWLENRGSALVYGRRAVCAVSPSTRAQIRAQLALRGPVHLAPPGVQRAPGVQPPPDVQTAPGTPRDRAPRTPARTRAPAPRIVCVGRLSRQKRWHHLIQALPALRREIPAAELHFIGDGDARHELEERATALGVRDAVVFHGRLPAPRRDALLATAWMTAAAAPREGWGLSVMEAAAAGVPTLAYDVPGLRDTVRDGRTGWLVSDGEEPAARLAAALHTLAPEARAAVWEERCRAWAARFTWSATTAHLLAVLTEERHRLGRTDRASRNRQFTDLCTLVTLPLSALNRADLTALRVTDLIDVSGPRARLLLFGVDEHGAGAVLTRLGVDAGAGRVDVRLARHHDTLGWQRHPPCCAEHGG